MSVARAQAVEGPSPTLLAQPAWAGPAGVLDWVRPLSAPEVGTLTADRRQHRVESRRALAIDFDERSLALMCYSLG